jgi:predicted 3-demethylubiquinone-9 3-methyltransferase (glyoxalase superfamily)
MKNQIHPCLWFDGRAKAAADFYCSIFENSKLTVDTPLVVNFELTGKKFMGLNGGPMFKINPSISFFVKCGSIDETNEIWNKLIDGGKALMTIDKYPWSERYGWVQDKFGLTWQVMVHNLADTKMSITPSLLFAGKQLGRAQEAINFYADVFENSSTDMLAPYPAEDTANAGNVMYSEFNLNKYNLIAMDGPADCSFNEAVSFVVDCDTQQEIDYYWNKLTEGGQESQCGWLKDKFGVSWQIVPTILGKLMSDPNKSQRVMKAFLQMKKFDIEKLEQA